MVAVVEELTDLMNHGCRSAGHRFGGGQGGVWLSVFVCVYVFFLCVRGEGWWWWWVLRGRLNWTLRVAQPHVHHRVVVGIFKADSNAWSLSVAVHHLRALGRLVESALLLSTTHTDKR